MSSRFIKKSKKRTKLNTLSTWILFVRDRKVQELVKMMYPIEKMRVRFKSRLQEKLGLEWDEFLGRLLGHFNSPAYKSSCMEGSNGQSSR